MATTAETIIGKCSRLVRASRTYILKNVSVDWGVRNDLAEAYRTGNTELKSVRQAPANISAIYPGNRFVVFALIEDPTFTPPTEIILRAQRDGHGEVLQFSVPVQIAEFPPERHPQPLIQTLAARRAIMDIEDSNRLLFTPDAKALVIRLGTQYQLASKYTSFIAVDKRTKAEVKSYSEELVEEDYPTLVHPLPFSSRGARLNNPHFASPQAHHSARMRTSSQSLPRGGSFAEPSQTTGHLLSVTASPTMDSLGSAWPEPTSFSLSPQSDSARRARRPQRSSASYHALSASASYAGFASPTPPSPRAAGQRSRLGQPAPAWIPRNRGRRPPVQTALPPASDDNEEQWDADLASMDLSQDSVSSVQAMVSDFLGLVETAGHYSDPASPRSTEDRIVQLIRLQSFDGSFPPTTRLLSLLGGAALLGEARTLGVSEKIWATVLAIVYLKRHMKDQPELLEGLVEKATEFIAQTPGINTKALFSRAEVLLSTA